MSKAEKISTTTGSDTAVNSVPPVELHPHHVSKILDEVLEEPDEVIKIRHARHPLAMDAFFTVGLLTAVAGFTLGMFKMYINHSAEQSITQHNYKPAIALLEGEPLKGIFEFANSNSIELLNQALYLDALDHMEAGDMSGALQELQRITPGSKFFALAQQFLNENSPPAAIQLQAGASVTNPVGNPDLKLNPQSSGNPSP